MFVMKIERQMNMHDRTLLLGVPQFDKIPEHIAIDNKNYKVKGISCGVRPPFVSLETEKITKDVVGKEISA